MSSGSWCFSLVQVQVMDTTQTPASQKMAVNKYGVPAVLNSHIHNVRSMVLSYRVEIVACLLLLTWARCRRAVMSSRLVHIVSKWWSHARYNLLA